MKFKVGDIVIYKRMFIQNDINPLKGLVCKCRELGNYNHYYVFWFHKEVKPDWNQERMLNEI